MPYTLIPEEPSAPAPQARFTVVDEPATAFGAKLGNDILSLGGLVPNQAPNIAGAVNYIQEGGAEGSFGRGQKANIARNAQLQEDNPRASLLGDVASVVIPIPGVAAAAAPRLAARAIEEVLRWGGRAGQGLSAYSVWNDLQRGETPGVGDVLSFALGRGSGKLAKTMRAGRLERTAADAAERAAYTKMKAEGFRGDLSAARKILGQQKRESIGSLSKEMQQRRGIRRPPDPNAAASVRMTEGMRGPPPSSPEPAPPTGTLSAEMRAALRRGKFRHDYSTGEWADLLAPGE